MGSYRATPPLSKFPVLTALQLFVKDYSASNNPEMRKKASPNNMALLPLRLGDLLEGTFCLDVNAHAHFPQLPGGCIVLYPLYAEGACELFPFCLSRLIKAQTKPPLL